MTSLSINLPQGFISKVKVGEKVVSGQVIAGKNIVGVDHEINLFNVLQIDPAHAGKILVKRAGDKVSEGSVVAIKKGTLSIGARRAVSPVAGTIFKFDEDSGILTIRSTEEAKIEDIFSPVDGEVELCDNEKIVLKTTEEVFVAQDAIGQGNISGTLLFLKDETVEGSDIKSDVKGKIVAGKILTREALAKSLGLGAQGLIAQKIMGEDLEDLRKRLIGTPIFIVEEKDFEKIQKSCLPAGRAEGKKVFLEPGKKTILLLKK